MKVILKGRGWLGVLLMVLLAGCAARELGREGASGKARFHAAKLAEMDREIGLAIDAGKCPGGVLWVEHRGAVHRGAYGARAVVPGREAMTEDTIFDAASLTKVLSTTPAVMWLVERGKLDPEAPVSRYLPGFGINGKESITVRQLLTHTSGLRPGIGRRDNWTGWDGAIQEAFREAPTHAAGTRFVYSDINFIVLGEVVRKVSGRPLEELVRDEIYRPLGMRDTGYRPRGRTVGPVERVAPTEQLEDGMVLRGVVHDPTARHMGGVAGHAGLFTTAADVARFSRMMLNGGVLGGRRVFESETVRAMTSVQSPAGLPSRGFGWDIDSPYAGPRGAHFGAGSYGHTGWTGTSLWIDPETATFVVFLSNRNHPTEAGDVRGLRRKLGTLAAEALTDVEWPVAVGRNGAGEWDGADEWGWGAADRVEERGVLNGIDVLEQSGFEKLKGRRVGLISNHTGKNRVRQSTIDLLHGAPGVTLVALFSPEHGIRGLLDEKVSDGRDEKTGLPVYSLYGERRIPAPEQLEGLDVLVFDIQDIGCRFYTYISTLGNSMEAAAKAGVEFMVLDRVNPVNGVTVEGPMATGTPSFIAWHRIPLRHGMTAGELARMFNEERKIGARLTVVPCSGWRRADWFDATGLPWTNPSPNMRSLTEATLYPGVGLMEFCAVSVGRGTGTPFEVIGAPYVDDLRLARELNGAGLAGVRFVPVRFTPTASVHSGKECGGVQILLTDRDAFRAADLGVVLATTLHRMHPEELKLDKMTGLLANAETLERIRAGMKLSEVRRTRDAGLDEFRRRRARHLLYR